MGEMFDIATLGAANKTDRCSTSRSLARRTSIVSAMST